MVVLSKFNCLFKLEDKQMRAVIQIKNLAVLSNLRVVL